MLKWMARKIGGGLARFLSRSTGSYATFSVTPIRTLCASLHPGDVLLVEGDTRTSVAIKYLTQSIWSHAALYVGDVLGRPADGSEPNVLIEADLVRGVVAVPISKYRTFNTRICRPVGLADKDQQRVASFMVEWLGMEYDLKNIFDLMRYLLPTPPVPIPWRRRMLVLGSGDPTRAICSSLIAQAFQSVRYPILPNIREGKDCEDAPQPRALREFLEIRHHSLFTPRDFDLSPYFRIVKPTLETGFDYTRLNWYEDIAEPPQQVVMAAGIKG